MQNYINVTGNSNIEAYEIGSTYIDVKFYGTPKIYRYSYSSAGKENVEYMKSLAISGSGLNAFINKNVKFNYEK